MTKKMLWLLLFFILSCVLIQEHSVAFAAVGDGLGTITPPPGLPKGSGPGGGLIIILTNVLRLIFVGGGIYAFIRIVLAGLKFMSAGGDAKAIQQAWDSIWQSIVGVVIIVSSYIVAALLGLLLFGDVRAIINPQIYGPGTSTVTTPSNPGLNVK